tara:strand:+ start:4601 stop:5617 length:1017 start_codon:yes stop_codon:yes gene_type:complete
MNALILGLGSIGQRHLRNLNKIDKKIKFFAIRKKYFTPNLNKKNQIIKTDIKKKYDITYFKSLDELYKSKVDIDLAFICTPSKYHVDEAISLIKKNINVFVEKPLGSSLKNISKLSNLIKFKKNIKHMMGYQLKFNPIILKLKKILDKKSIGEILYVSIHHGENINDFHPYEDYKNSYAARKDLGGGVILCQIHELDYLLFLFQKYEIKIINSYFKKLSNLDIDVEDTFVSNIEISKKQKRALCNIHLNFYERPKKRKIEILGQNGKISCNLNTGEIFIFKGKDVRKIKFKFDRNEIFIKQVKYFLNSIKKNKKIDKCYDVLNGVKSLLLALDLKKTK